MSEMLTTDTYKTIYNDITPSDEFRQRMLNQGAETRIYKMKPRLSYAAAIVACMVLMVSGTVYAYTHPALIRALFGEDAPKEFVEKVYAPIEQTIIRDGYIYIVEGNIYDEQMGTGCLTVRIEAEDGSIPDVKASDSIFTAPIFGQGIDGHRFWVGEKEMLFLFRSGLSGFWSWPQCTEEGVFYHLKYTMLDPEDELGLIVASTLYMCVVPPLPLLQFAHIAQHPSNSSKDLLSFFSYLSLLTHFHIL